MSRVTRFRGGSRAAATSKMESFVIIVNGWEPLTIITKHSILDVAAATDPPLKKIWRIVQYGLGPVVIGLLICLI